MQECTSYININGHAKFDEFPSLTYFKILCYVYTISPAATAVTFQATVDKTRWPWGNLNGNDKRSSSWSPRQIFKLSKNLPRQPRRDWPTLCALVERGERNRTWQDVTDLNTTWSMSVTPWEARVFLGTPRSVKFCYGLPRLNARLATSVLRQLHLLTRFASLSHSRHGELRWTVAISSSLATMLHGVLQFTCRSTTVGHGARGLWAEVIKRLPSRETSFDNKTSKKEDHATKEGKTQEGTHVSPSTGTSCRRWTPGCKAPPPLPCSTRKSLLLLLTQPLNLKLNLLPRKLWKTRLVVGGGWHQEMPQTLQRKRRNLWLTSSSRILCSTLRGLLATKTRRLKTDCGRSKPCVRRTSSKLGAVKPV